MRSYWKARYKHFLLCYMSSSFITTKSLANRFFTMVKPGPIRGYKCHHLIQLVQSPEDMDNSNATTRKSHYWSPQCRQRISGRRMWYKSRATLLSAPSRIPLSPITGWWSSPWNRCHVVAWEDTRHATPQRRALEPAVLALLNDPVHLPFAELQLIVLLRLVGIQG